MNLYLLFWCQYSCHQLKILLHPIHLKAYRVSNTRARHFKQCCLYLTQKNFQTRMVFVLLSVSGSSPKYHLRRILLQKSLKSDLSSGSLIFLWMGAQSNPFSNILIFASDKTLLLKLKMVSEQKYSDNLDSSVVTDVLFWIELLVFPSVLSAGFSISSEDLSKFSKILRNINQW